MSDDYMDSNGQDEGMTEDEVLEAYKNGTLVPAAAGDVDEYASSPMYNTGGGMFDQRPTQTQAQLKYLLGTDEVPDHIKKHRLWSLVSRHLQLIRVEGVQDLPYYRREIRDIIRTAMWSRDMRKISYSDLRQIEFFAEMLLRKSIDRGERILLASQITRSQVEDLGERTPSGGMQGNSGGGLMGSLRKMFGGMGGK
jgi:hypothetical protein